MIDKLLRRFGLRESPTNDFENLVVPNDHVNLIFSNGAVVNDALGSTVQTKDRPEVAGQYIQMDTDAVKDGVYINLYGIMHNSDSYEEALTRVIETEIHEMMHWGDESTGDDRHSGLEHQEPFNDIIFEILDHCDQVHYDFKKDVEPLGFMPESLPILDRKSKGL